MNTIANGTTASHIPGRWIKSSYSGPQGNCVEITRVSDGGVAVRNSRHPEGPALVFTAAEWDAFLSGALDGEFGLPA